MSSVIIFDYDAFISYSGDEEAGFVAELLEALRSNSNLDLLVYHFPSTEKQGRPDHDFRADLRDALRNSRYLVAVITTGYLASEYCLWELTTFWRLMREQVDTNIPVQNRHKLLPVFLTVPPRDCKNDTFLQTHLPTRLENRFLHPQSSHTERDDAMQVLKAVSSLSGIDALRPNQPLTHHGIISDIIRTLSGQHHTSLALPAPTMPDMWTNSSSTVPPRPALTLHSPSTQNLIDAVLRFTTEESTIAAVGARGLGGVGKTTACQIVANHPTIRRLFQSILWMDLGGGATTETVVRQLAKIVKGTGGNQCSTAILSCEQFNPVIGIARKWFLRRPSNIKALLIFDNLFPHSSTPFVLDGNWVTVLVPIVGSNSCVLFSSRYGVIRSVANHVEHFDLL